MTFLLNQIFRLTQDWGLAIFIISSLLRGILFPLNIKQQIFMLKNQKLQPKIDELKIKYKNNQEKLNQKLMELHKKEGISFTGCLGPLVQLPLFILLYRSINTLTMNSGTILVPWVISLNAPDPLNIMPILYGVIQTIGFVLKNNDINIIKLIPYLAIVLVMWNASVSLWIYWMVNGLFTLGEGVYFKLSYE